MSVVHGQDCAQQDFEKVAKISVAPALRFDPPAADGATGGKRAALLDLTFTPTGAPGSVTLLSTEDTTLLAQREGTFRTFDLTLTSASAPTTITLDYVPEGCLQHRVAEDKIGTLIPLRVDQARAESPSSRFAEDAELRRAIAAAGSWTIPGSRARGCRTRRP